MEKCSMCKEREVGSWKDAKGYCQRCWIIVMHDGSERALNKKLKRFDLKESRKREEELKRLERKGKRGRPYN